jgi:hypothetical protein
MSVTWEPRISPPQLDEWAAPNGTPRQDAVLQAVSILLGVGTARLQTDLSSGQSLEAIASSQHVSINQLVSTIAGALESSRSDLASMQAQMIAADIAQRTGALQIAPGIEHDNTDRGSSSAPIRGVNNGARGRLDMQL